MLTLFADFDPEEDIPIDDSDEQSGPESEDENAGREHYATVGKSNLRQPREVALGPQYRGAKVTRAHLEADSEDDDEDDIDSEGDGLETDSEDEEGSDAEEEQGTDDTDLSDDENAGQDEAAAKKELAAARKDEQRKAISTTLSEAGRLDAEKGRAVKKQRTTFDTLLNTRMKLQKSLVAANTLVGTPVEQLEAEREAAQQALDAAETAAFNLWDTLTTFREHLAAAKTGTKRKRTAYTAHSPTEELWSHIETQEAASRPTRDATLKKWSDKAKGQTATTTQTGRLNQTAQTTIVDIIQQQLSDPTRLIKRAHAPRSCAPLQVSQRIAEDEKIYDDADFYGLLLKELLEQKSADSVAASAIDVGFQMRRDNKTKKNVDTKASKGRKLRYTVHEKLQNFMAPETDKAGWGERQADELFSSLFGQRVALGERDDDGDQEMEDEIVEDGVMLFGR